MIVTISCGKDDAFNAVILVASRCGVKQTISAPIILTPRSPRTSIIDSLIDIPPVSGSATLAHMRGPKRRGPNLGKSVHRQLCDVLQQSQNLLPTH